MMADSIGLENTGSEILINNSKSGWNSSPESAIKNCSTKVQKLW